MLCTQQHRANDNIVNNPKGGKNMCVTARRRRKGNRVSTEMEDIYDLTRLFPSRAWLSNFCSLPHWLAPFEPLRVCSDLVGSTPCLACLHSPSLSRHGYAHQSPWPASWLAVWQKSRPETRLRRFRIGHTGRQSPCPFTSHEFHKNMLPRFIQTGPMFPRMFCNVNRRETERDNWLLKKTEQIKQTKSRISITIM